MCLFGVFEDHKSEWAVRGSREGVIERVRAMKAKVPKLKILAKEARWNWNATKDVRWICTISEDTS